METKRSRRVKRSVAFLPFWALTIAAVQMFQLPGIVFLAVAILGTMIPGFVLMKIWPDDRDSPHWSSVKIPRDTLARWLPFFAALFAAIGANLLIESLWIPIVAALAAGVPTKILVRRLLS